VTRQTRLTQRGWLASRWRRAAFEEIADVQRSAQPALEALSKPTHKACGAAAFAQGEHALACEFFQQVRWVVPSTSLLSSHSTALHCQWTKMSNRSARWTGTRHRSQWRPRESMGQFQRSNPKP
jgi:hypothetical protein